MQGRQRFHRKLERRLHTEIGGEAPAWPLDELPDRWLDVPQFRPAGNPRLPGTPRRALPAAFHTTDTLPQYPRRQQGGRAIASLGAPPNPTEHLVPGDADWSLAVELIQPPVQFLALGLRQRDRLRRSR